MGGDGGAPGGHGQVGRGGVMLQAGHLLGKVALMALPPDPVLLRLALGLHRPPVREGGIVVTVCCRGADLLQEGEAL